MNFETVKEFEIQRGIVSQLSLNDSVLWTGVDRVLANNDWETIAKVCRSGNANKYWNVGDTKTVISKDGRTYTVRICDMKKGRYEYSDGSGYTNVVFEYTRGPIYSYFICSSSNSGGWRDCSFRIRDAKTVWNDEMFSDEILNQLKSVNILGGKGGGTASGVNVSEDLIFLPSEIEIFGNVTYSVGLEESPLGVYDWYALHNTKTDRIRYSITGNPSAGWMTRSAVVNNTSNFSSIRGGTDQYGGTVTTINSGSPAYPIPFFAF